MATVVQGSWRPALRGVGRTMTLAASLFLAWFFFHLLGRNLAAGSDQLSLDQLWDVQVEMLGHGN